MDMTVVCPVKCLSKKKKKVIKFLAGPLHCSVVLFDARLLPCYRPEREGEQRDKTRGEREGGRERQRQRMSGWGERGEWLSSSVSRALPRGKDVLNQGFVHRHNRGPARAQGCSVWQSIDSASRSLPSCPVTAPQTVGPT